MTNQIFKKHVPNEILYNLFEVIGLKYEKYYIIDNTAYKKILYHNLTNGFIESIIEYYHMSKQFYVTRKFTYKSFTNIIRQICKFNNIQYLSEMKYNESIYNIIFKIYY